MKSKKNLYKKRKIGKIDDRVIYLLDLNLPEGTPIYINNNNISRIKRKHPNDYAKYGKDIVDIINKPTYITQHPINKSIEYIKVYKEEQDYVLIAIRLSSGGNYYVRTLFIMSDKKVYKYWMKKAFKSY